MAHGMGTEAKTISKVTTHVKAGSMPASAVNTRCKSFLPLTMLLQQVYSNSAQTHEHHFKVLNAQLKQAPKGQAVQLTPGQHSFKVTADIPMQSEPRSIKHSNSILPSLSVVVRGAPFGNFFSVLILCMPVGILSSCMPQLPKWNDHDQNGDVSTQACGCSDDALQSVPESDEAMGSSDCASDDQYSRTARFGLTSKLHNKHLFLQIAFWLLPDNSGHVFHTGFKANVKRTH